MAKYSEYKKAYYQKNKEDIKAYKQAWHQANRKHRLQVMRTYTLYRNYGITDAQYIEILKKQDYKCAICLRHERVFKKKLAVDHCHKTKKIRGLLCPPCNKNLVSTFDSPLYKAAKRYVEISR